VENDSASGTEPAVQKFSPSGTFLTLIASKGTGAGKINGDAFFVTVDPNKNVYVADYGSDMVDKFAPY